MFPRRNNPSNPINEDKNVILKMHLCVKDVDKFKKAPWVIKMTDIGPDTITDGHLVTARIKQGSLQELENDSNVISYQHGQRIGPCPNRNRKF